jgi:serine/threonine protein kinase
MNAAAWEQAKSLLAEAADLPVDDRAQFVIDHCRDPELRREVLDLLASPAPLSEIITAGALAPGDRLGPYVIERLLGRGGMGVVYRARDTRLDRTVAIKVLPPEFSTDPGRRERFDREARAVAALDDPHICILHDVGHDNGIDFLVMQYLDGETLAARLARGRLPLDEALRLTIDIAAALDRAHRAGLVHRDLKPANVMVTKAGAVLLDFGLARRTGVLATTSGTADPAARATLTAEGTLVGTVQYMAPEQLEGHEADARSDIWAFGCVLYEMLTGTRAFVGESQPSLIAAIMSGTLAGPSERVPSTPPAIDRLIRTCLAKNPDDRFQSSHDVLMTLLCLRDASSHSTPPSGDVAQPKRRRFFVGATVGVIVAAAAALGYLAARRASSDRLPVIRFDLPAPLGWQFTASGAISPDGRHVVAAARNDKGVNQLWLRTLGDEDGRWLADTENGGHPFWSPDSHTVAFFANGKLRRLDITGPSAPLTICDAPNPRGGAWMSDNQIVFAPSQYSGLVRVAAAGGEPVPVTSLAVDRGELSHRFPASLPNRQLIYFVLNRNGHENGIWLISLDDPGNGHRIVPSRDSGQVVGDSLFWPNDAGTLLTQRLDPSTASLLGDPETVVTRVGEDVQGHGTFSISSGGSIVVRTRLHPSTQLAWVTRNGQMLEPLGDVGFNADPRLSPDGRRVAFFRHEEDRSELWVFDLERRAATRVLSEQNRAPSGDPGWSPDGGRIFYGSSRGPGNSPSLYVISAAGGQATPVVEQSLSAVFSGWAPDGQTAILTQQSEVPQITGELGGRFGIKTMGPDRKLVTYFDPGYSILGTTVSPNGRWIAFTSNQSRRREVFVIGFPEPGTPRQVSLAGGTQPRWRSDGRELFFLSPDSKLMAVDVNASDGDITFGRPSPLFDAPMLWWLQGWTGTEYDVSPGGQRFLIDVVREAQVSPLTVILNWSRAGRH